MPDPSVPPRLREKGRFPGWRIGIAVLAACVAVGLVAGAAVQDRKAELNRARVQAAGNVSALAEHAASLLRSVDLALDRVEAQVQSRPPLDVRNDAQVHKMLTDLQAKLPHVDAVFVVDPEGRALVSSRAFPVPPYDVRDREYFLAARAGHDGLNLSQPFRGQMSRSVSFVISRPIMRDGRFAGVVAVSMFSPALQSLYQSVLGGTGASAVLMRTDGVVLMRSEGGQKWPDRLPERSDVMRAASSQEAGLFLGTSLLEGEKAVYAFQVLRDRKVMVALTVLESDVLSPWYRRTLLFGGGAALAVVSLLAWSLPRTRPASNREGTWLPPLLRRRTGWQRRVEARGKSLPSGSVRVLDALTARVRQYLAADDPNRADRAAELAQRLLAFSAGAPPAPRALDPGAVLTGLRDLMGGPRLPAIQFHASAGAPPQVHADPAQLTLVLLDAALSLAVADPAAHLLEARAEVRTVSANEVDGLLAGNYVCVSLAAAGMPGAGRAQPPFPSGPPAVGADLFGLAAEYGQDLHCVVVALNPSGREGASAQLWLPEALPEAAGSPQPG